MIRVRIQGDNKFAEVRRTDVPKVNGLVTLTSPLIPQRPYPTRMLNATFGREMNQNIAFGGTPVGIHDGTDSAQWTGSNIVGTKYTADSTDQAQAGTKSSLINNPSVNDVWEFNSGGTQALGSYVAFSMFIYVDKDWTTDSIEMYGWDGAAEQGVRVRLEDYFEQTSFGVWQFFSVPIDDMGLTTATIESLRMSLVSKAAGPAPKFYIDEFQIENTGDEAEYVVVSPDASKDYYISRVVLSISDNVTWVVTNGTMIGLDYTAFLGVSALASGLLFEHIHNDETIITEIYTGIGKMFELGWVVATAVSDGTNTCITLARDFDVPILLTGPPAGNRLSFTVRDNLSTLLSMNCSIVGARPR